MMNLASKTAAALAVFALVLFIVEQAFVLWEYTITFELVHDIGGNFKDFWSATYNITNSFIVFVALFALGVAYIQSDEARKSRIAQVFIEIEGRWSGKDLEEGKSVIQSILREFVDVYLSSESAGLGLVLSDEANSKVLRDFFDDRLTKMMKDEPAKYEYVTSLFDFFDYIGILVKNRYLNMPEMADMMGDTVVFTYDLAEAHLQRLRSIRQQLNDARGLPGVPLPYNFFISFVGSLRGRFEANAR